MKENVVAVNSAVSVPARAGHGGWPVLNPRKFFLVAVNVIVTIYPLFKMTALFFFMNVPHIAKKNGTHISHYICGADNSLINGVRLVL